MEFKGSVKDIIFQNDESGYVVGRLKTDDDLITFVGTIPFVFTGQLLKLTGSMIKHQTFGEQLKVEAAEEMLPESPGGMEKYLSSGVISGIGPVTAKRIIKAFGSQTFEVMDNQIDRLQEVEGIGVKKLAIIKDSYLKSREVRNIMVFLQSYGVTASQCMKIYYRYGQNSIALVSENPYILSEDIPTFGFKTADKIAENLGIDKDSPFRIQSGIKYVVNNFSGLGNTCIPLKKLTEEAFSMLEVSEDKVVENIKTLILKDSLVSEELAEGNFIFAPPYYQCELSITKRILAMTQARVKHLTVKLDDFLEKYERENAILLHGKQKAAIKGIEQSGLVIITGGPGTGKTTIIKCILALMKTSGLKVLMAAPTGRAAKRMTETTGEVSKTIHRLLDIGVADDGEEFGGDAVLECDCVIIDEASMVDVVLMNNLMNAIKPGTRLIMVGDVDQLPSVGPGKVLGDIIHSGTANVIQLEMIYRQGSESMIASNAHRINHGENPVLNGRESDFFFIGAGDAQSAQASIVELITKRLPEFNKTWDPVRDIQILSPMRKGDLGIYRLNELLREVLNPVSGSRKTFTPFQVGDKVMQTRNNYNLKSRLTLQRTDHSFEAETGVFNGDIGYVRAIDDEDELVTVCFDDERYVDYTPMDLDDLELAYAVTIHKSQGSEFRVVIMPLYMGPPLLMNRNLLYTAVTRARELVVLVGDLRALHFMIKNNRSFERYTSLGYRLKKAVSVLEEISTGSLE